MKKLAPLFIPLMSVHLFILTQLQFTAWPEMFSYPFLISKEFLLYKDIGLPYQPFLPLALEVLFKIFGYEILTLKVITWLIILSIDLLIFITSIKIIGRKYLSLLPLGIYILLQPFTSGNMLWFDLATTPLILLSLFSLVFLKDFKQWFLTGLFLSIATFIKQQAVIIFIPLIIYLVFKERKNIVPMFLGALIPSLFVGGYVLTNNIRKDYLFWTFEVPIIWYPKFPGYTRLPSLFELIISVLIFLPGIFLYLKNYRKVREANIGFLFFFSAFVTSFPRFDFFRMQPALALYVFLLIFLVQKNLKHIILIIAPALLVVGMLTVKSLPTLNTTRFYGSQEKKISNEIKRFSKEQDKIYLLGVDSINYVLSSRLPSKPWIDNYVWYLEIPGMQDRVIEGFKKTPPQTIFIKKPNVGNWYGLGTYRPLKIVEYIEGNYEQALFYENEQSSIPTEYEKIKEEGIEVWKRKK